ncbi:MAG: hypothetical protein JXR68_07910 [Bacteroidales bacterium]|nr:hypothetical protein [Bacteroidales bacterium]
MNAFKPLLILTLLYFLIGCKNNNIDNTQFIIDNKLIDNPFIVNEINNRQLITFEHIKDVSLVAIQSKTGHPYINQFLDTDSGLYLVSYFKFDSVLNFYNVSTKKKLEIPLNQTGDIFGLNYVKDDSIFLIYNPLYFNNYYNHDSSLIMINKSGEIIKNFLYDEAHVSGTKNGLLYNNTNIAEINDSLTFLNTFYKVLDYENQKLFFTVERFTMPADYIGGEDYFIVDLPFIGYEDLNNEKFIGLNKLKHPFLSDHLYYPKAFYYTDYELLHDGHNILISFQYTDLIFKHNYITNEIQKITKFNSFFLDTIKASIDQPTNSDFSNRFKYSNIYFDKKNNRFFRWFNFPLKFKKTSIITADKNYNVTGEGILPDGCFKDFYPISEDTLVFINYIKTDQSSDSIYLSYYKINYSDKGIIDLTNKLRIEFEESQTDNITIKDYIEKVTDISDITYSVIIIPTSMSCVGCADYTTNYYSANYKVLADKPAYLLIADANTSNGKNILRKYNLYMSFNNIYFDSTNTYINYHSNNMSHNPRLVLIENNKIILDKIYDAFDIKQLQEDNTEFLLRNGFINGTN